MTVRGDLCTQKDAALQLGVSRELVRRWTRAGIVPYFADPENGRPIYSVRALVAWQDAQGVNAAGVTQLKTEKDAA